MLLDDFLNLLRETKFDFLYQVIVPILMTDDRNYVPISIHKAF